MKNQNYDIKSFEKVLNQPLSLKQARFITKLMLDAQSGFVKAHDVEEEFINEFGDEKGKILGEIVISEFMR